MSATPRLEDWVGKRDSAEDVVIAGQVAKMAAMLDWHDAALDSGAPLPALWHWMFFAANARQSALGPDGHPARGGFMPPVALPRRMFAGAHLVFHDAIRVGDTIQRHGEVIGIDEKNGKSGRLVFVRVRYRITSRRGLAIEEEQTIVYRQAPKGPPPALAAADLRSVTWQRRIMPDPVVLFRYSALTFNAHRIHYDLPYARQVEGYPGLIVHGPLIATWLAELARAETRARPLAEFRFRAIGPLFDTAPFTAAGRLCDDARGCDLMAVDAAGNLAMQAEARFAA